MPDLVKAWDDGQKPLSAKIIRNVLSSGLRALLLAPVPFVMTPLILKKIGPGGYGTWAVFVAFGSLTSLADLGMVGTVSKYVAEYHAQRDFHALNRLLSTGLAIFAALSLAVASLIWFCSPLITEMLFRRSPAQGSDLVTLFRYFIIVVISNIVILLFSSVTSGLQRLDITNSVNSINILGAALVGGVLLIEGWGLRGLVLGQICSSIITVMTYCVLIRKLLPQAVLGARHVDAEEAKRMFGFSLRLYFTQAAVAIHNQLEKFLLALFVGVEAAGSYDIASSVVLKLRGVVGLVLGPVLPAASELDALNDRQRLMRLYYRAHKYLAFLGIGLACFVSVISVPFVELWIGSKLAFVALPLTGLMWVNLYNLVTGPGFLTFAGSGYLKPGIQSAVVGLGLNILLSVALIYRFGFAGAVLGTSVSLVFASSFFLFLFHRHTGYSAWRLFREAYAKPLAGGIALSVPMWLVFRAVTPSWTGLIVAGVVFATLYVAVILASRFFDQYDWGKAEGLIPMVRHARRIIRNA
jgi:O-antigen/teichoic acid export membrane protein